MIPLPEPGAWSHTLTRSRHSGKGIITPCSQRDENAVNQQVTSYVGTTSEQPKTRISAGARAFARAKRTSYHRLQHVHLRRWNWNQNQGDSDQKPALKNGIANLDRLRSRPRDGLRAPRQDASRWPDQAPCLRLRASAR